MANKILACISAEGATVAQWRRRRLTDLRRFTDDQNGLAAFEEYIRRAPKSTISIMVDSIDEDYRIEKLPRTGGADRAQLIARKQRQLFRATPYATAGLIDRTTGQRREDQYLFAAATRPELLAPWLRIINGLGAPISGIYLLPVVTLSAVERLEIKRPSLLIISKNESGLRQTFCKQNKLRVSRLTPLQSEPAPDSEFYAEEINSTRMYLDALTVTHVDEAVTAVVLDHDGSLADLPAAILRDRPNTELLRLGPEELQSTIGIDASDLSASADALHLHLLANARPTMNLVPPTMKTRLQVHLFGKYIYAASGAVAAFGLLWWLIVAAVIMFEGRKIDQLAEQARLYLSRYQEVTESFPEAPASSEVLRDSVEAAKRLDDLRQTPRAFMLLLGAVLRDSPAIGLSRIDWIYGSPERLGTLAQTTDLSLGTQNETGQFGLVSAEVLAYQGDHQAALRNIRAFTRQLADDPRVAQVEVIRLPIDLDPNAGLNGSTASSQQTAQSAPFEVAVALRNNGQQQ